jgi:hypothetical protein
MRDGDPLALALASILGRPASNVVRASSSLFIERRRSGLKPLIGGILAAAAFFWATGCGLCCLGSVVVKTWLWHLN